MVLKIVNNLNENAGAHYETSVCKFFVSKTFSSSLFLSPNLSYNRHLKFGKSTVKNLGIIKKKKKWLRLSIGRRGVDKYPKTDLVKAIVVGCSSFFYCPLNSKLDYFQLS